MNRLAILLVIFLAFGCKSIKKVKQSQYSIASASVAEVVLDTSRVEQLSIQSSHRELEELEEIETKFQSLDSAGITVIKPVTITRRKQRSVVSDHNRQDSMEQRGVVDTSDSESISTDIAKDLDKSSEGADVIEQAVSAIFPTWGKILASILLTVLPVLWAWWKKNKNLD